MVANTKNPNTSQNEIESDHSQSDFHQTVSNEDSKKSRNYSSLGLIYRHMLRYKGLMLCSVIALVLSVVSTLTIFRSIEFIIDEGFQADNISALPNYFKIAFILIGVLAISSSLRMLFVLTLGEKVIADIRSDVHSHLLSLPPSFFEENLPTEIASRLTADTTIVQMVIGLTLSIALRSGLTAIGALILVITFNPLLVGAIVVIAAILVIPFFFFGRKIRHLSNSDQENIAHVGTMATETFFAIQLIQSFTHEEIEKRKFGESVKKTLDNAKRRIQARSLMNMVITLIVFSFASYGLWRGANAVIEGSITGGELASFMGLTGLFVTSISSFVEVFAGLQRASGAATRISNLLSIQPSLESPKHAQKLPEYPLQKIEFDSVCFAYPSKKDQFVLRDLSLVIEPRTTLAIIGTSGAGKTTILQLLMRFLDPQKGKIVIDGIDIRNAQLADLRSLITFVPQDTFVFSDTIESNIRLGNFNASDQSIKHALDMSLCTEFVEALPNGINTFIGDRGVRLSGGQRQRLSIARAILKDSPILLLDEATSSLDSESESLVQNAMSTLISNRTTIIVAHRLATLRDADKIVVLDEGKIAAEGTHLNLMKSDNLYSKLVQLQTTPLIS